MTLQQSECERCGDTRLMKNPDKYCITCCMAIRDKILRYRNDRFESSDGTKTARSHWDNLPTYIRHDIVENIGGIEGVEI